MSIETHVTLVGIHKLRKKLDMIIDGVRNAPTVIQNVGKIMEIEMKVMAPIDTGRLHDEIEATDLPNGVRVESGAPYSGYPEYGTRFQAPQPFFNPAIQNNKHRLLQGIIKRITD